LDRICPVKQGDNPHIAGFAPKAGAQETSGIGFGDDQTLVQMAGEVHYVFSQYQAWKPYAGAGLGLTYINYDSDHPKNGSDTEGSLTAIGGVETDLKQGMKLFFEFKVGLAHDDPDIKFGVGLSW
jgi:opacity protein-like surface antigen